MSSLLLITKLQIPQVGSMSALDEIGAKHLLPIHYVFTDPVFNAELIKINTPDAVIFTRELETWFMPLPDK